MMLLLAVSLAEPAEPAEAEETAEADAVEFGVLPEVVSAVSRSVVNAPLAYRMKAVSEPLLGLPYLVNGHGEGRAPDADPPARYDSFDCLTFLEEVLALSMAGDPLGVPQVRNALRYRDGVVDYSNRHHFMMAQWIPENIAAGFVKDITHTLGETHRIEKEVSRQTWLNWQGSNAFDLSIDELPVGSFGLNVLSLDAAEAAIDQIPAGAIILTVRQPRDWKPIVVSHVGFVIPSLDGQPARVRHATKMQGGSVRDHFLAWYIDHIRWYQRPVEGITVLMPVEQGPRQINLID